MVKNKFEQERKFTFLINKFYHLIFSESGCHDGPFAGEIL